MTAFLRFKRGVIGNIDGVGWIDEGAGWPPPEFLDVLYGPRTGAFQIVPEDWRSKSHDIETAVSDGDLLYTRYRRVSYSILDKIDIEAMPNVRRGAQYEAAEGWLESPPPPQLNEVKVED